MTQLLAFFKMGAHVSTAVPAIQQTTSNTPSVASTVSPKPTRTVAPSQPSTNEFTASAEDDEWEDF